MAARRCAALWRAAGAALPRCPPDAGPGGQPGGGAGAGQQLQTGPQGGGPRGVDPTGQVRIRQRLLREQCRIPALGI
eukprot:7229538-Lingulodinium_polyedra.AAC.1